MGRQWLRNRRIISFYNMILCETSRCFFFCQIKRLCVVDKVVKSESINGIDWRFNWICNCQFWILTCTFLRYMTFHLSFITYIINILAWLSLKCACAMLIERTSWADKGHNRVPSKSLHFVPTGLKTR